MTYYVTRIWSAGQPPGFSDLYSSWWAAHELFLHGRSPYTPSVAHEIQAVIYGAPVTPSSSDPSAIAGGFAYPIYVVIFLWPTVGMNFQVARLAFAILLAILTLSSLYLYASSFGWPQSRRVFAVAGLFLLGSFPVLQGIRLQNLSLLAGFLIAVSLACLAGQRLITAGAFLALATFKPQFSFLLIAWLGLWTAYDWKHRRRFAVGFLSVLALLLTGSELLLPGWMGGFLHVASAYRLYTYGHSVLQVWLTQSGGMAAGIILIGFILVLCWRSRSMSSQSKEFFAISSLVLAATLVVIPTLEPHAQVLLIPGLLLLAQYRPSLGKSGKLAQFLALSVWIMLTWQWTGAFLLIVLGLLNPHSVGEWRLLPLYSSPLLPVASCLTLAWLLRKRPTGENRCFGESS
jgi:hypothetical protein